MFYKYLNSSYYISLSFQSFLWKEKIEYEHTFVPHVATKDNQSNEMLNQR